MLTHIRLTLWRPRLPYGYSYKSILCQTVLSRQPWASECPDVKNYKWWLNTVWHRMLYTLELYFSRMAIVGIKGLVAVSQSYHTGRCTWWEVATLPWAAACVCSACNVVERDGWWTQGQFTTVPPPCFSYVQNLNLSLPVSLFRSHQICEDLCNILPHDAMQSTVLPRQIVCLSVCDVEVSWSHVGILRK